jgi:hypothetical protein
MKQFSEETKLKMSISAKKRCSKEWKMNEAEKKRTKINDQVLIDLYKSGKTQDECATEMNVTRKVISNAMKRLNIISRKACKRNQTGTENHMWKGKNANITCKHRRLYRAFGQPEKCDICGTTDKSKWYDWANLTGDYDNPADFKRMCRSCHRKYDNARKKAVICHG